MKNPQPQEWLAEKYSKDKVADYKPFNFVDGEGVRCSIYLSGCLFACEGCYNKIVQNFDYGIAYTDELEEQIMADLRQPYVQGLTLLGGEPFLNTKVALRLAQRIRAEFGRTKDIWGWTGYYWDELTAESEDKQELLRLMDVLVDGRFELSKRDLTLKFRGSSNQTIIDVQKSLEAGEKVLWANAYE
nr:anaerobic ribonucleoside-triphosphate reductase activating protein [uncultured Trichococcus sp.]